MRLVAENIRLVLVVALILGQVGLAHARVHINMLVREQDTQAVRVRLVAENIHLVLVQVPIHGVEVLVYVNRVINIAVRVPVMPEVPVRPAEENMVIYIKIGESR